MPVRKRTGKTLIVETAPEGQEDDISRPDETMSSEPGKEDKEFWDNGKESEVAKSEGELADRERSDEPQEIDFLKEEGRMGSPRRLFWTALAIIVVVAALGTSLLIFKDQIVNVVKIDSALKESPTPSPAIEPIPTATPLERKDLTLQVLNGSGTPGVGQKAKELLEELGYTVEKVGNAKSFDYDKTQISIKEDKKDYFDLVREDLSKDYEVEENVETLEEDSKFDAIIIIGKKIDGR